MEGLEVSGGEVIAFQKGDRFPAAEVLDLAISVAIGRNLAASEEEMFSRIDDWFLRPASRAELVAAIGRLLERGWISRAGESAFDFCLTDAGIDGATTLSGGMIRMIDRGRGHLKTAFLLQMLDLDKGKRS